MAMRFELRLHKHQHKHTNWPRPRRRAPHHARGIARLPCDECLGPRDRRFSHTDRAAGVCEAAVGTHPVPACSRIATWVDASQQSGGSRDRRRAVVFLRISGARRRAARGPRPTPPGARVRSGIRAAGINLCIDDEKLWLFCKPYNVNASTLV